MSFLNRFLDPPERDDTLRSVIRNLVSLLNSRPGYGSRLRGYGIGDYLAEQGNKAAQLTILREIRDDIGAYEPRLVVRDLTARGRDAELRLHIQLRGTLITHSVKGTKPSSRPVTLRILFHLPSGAVSVEPADPADPREGADAS